jgi:hypothetical protein
MLPDVLAIADPDSTGLTPERWEVLGIAVTLIVAILSAVAVWLFAGGTER